MGKPITTTQGICFAFPDVCNTPSPTGQVPVAYPNIGQLSSTVQTASSVRVGGQPVVTSNSQIPTTTGDEAGSGGGIRSGTVKGRVEFVTFSQTVRAESGNVVRQFDTTQQNNGNAVGIVLGGIPNVLVGD